MNKRLPTVPDYPLAAEQHQKEFFDNLPDVVRSKDVKSKRYDSSMFSYLKDPLASKRMDNVTVPIYINDEGYKTITIPTKKFVCAGQSEPFDHPHVFLTMGNEDFMFCPYCSTRYEYEHNSE